MRPPEMSYSPAFYQTQDSDSSVPHSVFAPRPCHTREFSKQAHPALFRPSDEWTPACDVSPSSSGQRESHIYSPKISRRPSWVDDDSPVTRIVISSSGAINKEEQSLRSSWADRPSLMSAEQGSAPLAHKRGASDVVPVDDSQDALVMLVSLHSPSHKTYPLLTSSQFRLSIPVPIFSLCACLYTCAAILFAVLSSPLRICRIFPYLSNTTFKTQLCDLLSPSLHTHERLVCMGPATLDRSSSTQRIRSVSSSDQPSMLADSGRPYSTGASIAVLLICPFLSIVIVLFAWTAAFFWVFAMAMGNPDGTERKDDGRAAVLGVCKWWRTWLAKARKS